MSTLTQVGSGGVLRPDVTLKEDLTQIETTANTAKKTADDTAAFLVTRVPWGRTINNIPMDADIILTPEILGVYSREEMDAKLEAIESGGYNPVKVNGHLLNQDVILTPSDLGTYTGEEINTAINGRVPVTRTINGKLLSANITLSPGDVGAYSIAQIDTKLATYVPTSRTINGKPLSSDITLSAADFDGYTKSQIDTMLSAKANSMVSINGYDLRASFNLTATDVGALPASAAVPRTFKINGVAMTGDSMTVSSGISEVQLYSILDNYVIKTGATTVVAGFRGDIPFASEDGSTDFIAERLAKPARIVDTANDLTAEQANPVSFSTIFNSWDRVGMTNAAGVDETQQWSFNTSTNKIQCMMNTTGPTGFVTPSRYDKYTLEVQIASTSSDDDGIGVILASTYKDGLNYVLAATRTVGGWENIWEVALYKIQASSFTKTVITALNLPLKWGNGAYSATRAGSGYLENTGTGWATFPAGVKILAVRNGSSISLQTTDLGGTTYVSGANITVDLSTIENGVFLAPAPYGVMAFSQPDATFTTIQLTIDDNRLYDVRNGDIWEYNVSTTTWGKTTGSAYDYLKEGRLYYNPYTKKEFFAETKTRIVPINLGVNDVITKNSDGLVDKPVVLKNNVALRVEATPGSGTTRDAVSMTPAGVLTFGSSSAHTTIYSSDAPTVKVGSVESKIVTESSMPSGDNLGAMTFAKCSLVVAFGATVSGANLTPAAIGAGGVVAGTATLTGTWKCLGEISAADQATLFMKTA